MPLHEVRNKIRNKKTLESGKKNYFFSPNIVEYDLVIKKEEKNSIPSVSTSSVSTTPPPTASLTLSNINYQQTTNDNFVLASITNSEKNKVVKGIQPSSSFSGTYIVPFEQTFRGKAFFCTISIIGIFVIYRVTSYIDKKFRPSTSWEEKKKFRKFRF